MGTEGTGQLINALIAAERASRERSNSCSSHESLFAAATPPGEDEDGEGLPVAGAEEFRHASWASWGGGESRNSSRNSITASMTVRTQRRRSSIEDNRTNRRKSSINEKKRRSVAARVNDLLKQLVGESSWSPKKETVITQKLPKHQLRQPQHDYFVQRFFHDTHASLPPHNYNRGNKKSPNLKAKLAFLPFSVRNDIMNGNVAEDGPFVVYSQGVVLFVDISGFTALAKKYRDEAKEEGKNVHHAAEALSIDITTALNELTNICYEYGGDVAKFAGDALLCTWENTEDISYTFGVVRRAAYEMMKAIKAKQGLQLHGGIGSGKIVKVYLKEHIEEDMFDCGLRWHLVTGEACIEANELLERSKKGEILYIVEPDFGQRKGVVAQGRKLFDKGIGRISPYTNIKKTKGLFACAKPEWETEVWDDISQHEVESFIPPVLQRRLDNGSIDGGEIKRITTMFVSFEYLTLSETELHDSVIGGEKVAKLNSTFTALNGIVESQKGEIRDLLFDDKGCVFIAVFGALHEEVEQIKVLNCIKAAIDIATTFTRAQVGVSVGECFTGMCGNKDRSDFVVIGHDVILAARYMGKAKPGQVLVSKEVMDETAAHVKYFRTTFTNKKVTYECYVLNSELTNFGRKSEGPCIGREAQLQVLSTLFEQKECNSALLAGREGIGKSTLLHSAIGKHAHKVKSFHASGCAIEQSTRFYVLQQFLESLIGLDQQGSSELEPWEEPNLFHTIHDNTGFTATASNENAILGRLRDTYKMKCSTFVMSSLLPRKAQARDSLGRLSNMMLKLKALEPGEHEIRLLVEFFAELMLKVSVPLRDQGKKCVIAVENLHWVDLTSLRVIIELIKLNLDNFTFLLSTRPSTGIKKDTQASRVAELMKDLVKTERFHRLEMKNLNRQESEELTRRIIMGRDEVIQQRKIKDMMKQEIRYNKILKEMRERWGSEGQRRIKYVPVPTKIDQNVIDLVYKRTKGCPTYTTVLVNYLIEEDRVTKKDNAWMFDSERAREWAEKYLPPNVESIFRLRTNDLPGLSLKILKVASVMDREFSLQVLEKALLLDDSKIDFQDFQAALEVLNKQGFLEPASQKKSLHKGRLNFRIAKLYNSAIMLRFTSESTHEAMFQLLPKERVEYFLALVNKARTTK